MFEKSSSIRPGNGQRNHPLLATLTLIPLLIISTLLVFYAKYILHISIIYTHFLYVPIVLVAYRWGNKCLLLAFYFAFILIVPYYLVFRTFLLDDVMRGLMFMIVAFIAGHVGEKNRQSKKNLRESQQLLADTIDFLPDATFVIDLEGKVIIWNKAIAAFTGIPAAEIVGKGDYEYALPFYDKREPILVDLALQRSPEHEKRYQALGRAGDVLEAENIAPLLPESLLWGKASPLYDTSGSIVGAIESIRIINERQRY